MVNQKIDAMSYGRFIQDLKEFRRAGTKSGSEFNIFDTPTNKYFKLLFYFYGRGEDEPNVRQSTGLLVPSWNFFESSDGEQNSQGAKKYKSSEYWQSTTAWAYLKLNGENERAEKLEKFISLLSNINSESPWYFQSIAGLDTAVERKSVSDGKFDVSEIKRLQLKCLPDAVDDRIGTLLSLYRDVVWSWSMKREIIPSNLRKFDMAVYIYEAPMKYLHENEDIIDGKDNTMFKPSYRMLEFHNCEFDYNSIKTGYSEISNATGIQPTYTIDITYDDCYEVSYNSILMRTIGDLIIADSKYVGMIGEETKTPDDHIAQTDDVTQYNHLKQRVDRSRSFISNALGQVVGTVAGEVNTIAKRLLLGNIYTVSLTQVASDISNLAKGNIIATTQRALDYASTFQDRPSYNMPGIPSQLYSTNYINTVKKRKPSEGNIYSIEQVSENNEALLNQYNDDGESSVSNKSIYKSHPFGPKVSKNIGNIFNKSSIANN